MRNLTQYNITQAVLARFADTPNPRLLEILTSLTQHLHSFAREVALTEAEWAQGIQFLTATGHMSDDKRQEFILLSDVMGLSTLVVAMNNERPDGCTEATVFGPFYTSDAPKYELGDDIANGAKGAACRVNATLRGLNGEPIAGAKVNVWQADADGNYDVQYKGLEQPQGRGELRSGPQGELYFSTVLAEAYPIPHDGPVGDLLAATQRHPWRPAHLHFMIEAKGYQTLITHVFRDGDQWLDSDAVFGVRQSLIAPWTQSADGVWNLDYSFVLNPSAATSPSMNMAGSANT